MRKSVRFGLDISAAVAMLIALYLAIVYAPDAVNLATETERLAQHIFYFHVAFAWVGSLAFFVTALAGILYLASGDYRWDILAASSAEIGLAFLTAVMITGSLWAKPTWNTWWTWDPRLTTVSIAWLLYVAYFMLRAAVEERDRRARFAAVYGLFSFLSIPLTFLSIRLWRTIHPVIVGGGGSGAKGGFNLGSHMLHALLFSIFALTLLYLVLLLHRYRVERLAYDLEAIKERVLS